MDIDHIFLTIDAADFGAQSRWWERLLNRPWDREPMASCREWSLTDTVRFQVVDNPKGKGAATVTLHVGDFRSQVARLKAAGFAVPEPVEIPGFDNLRYAEFSDPEGNTVGLLGGDPKG